jgi:hypothetical protein
MGSWRGRAHLYQSDLNKAKPKITPRTKGALQALAKTLDCFNLFACRELHCRAVKK